MRNCINVIACYKREVFAQGSECDEAIHGSASRAMDCFASLAMTGIGHGILDTRAGMTS
jgi:hypothetical protein